jgi:hypothetical protein
MPGLWSWPPFSRAPSREPLCQPAPRNTAGRHRSSYLRRPWRESSRLQNPKDPWSCAWAFKYFTAEPTSPARDMRVQPVSGLVSSGLKDGRDRCRSVHRWSFTAAAVRGKNARTCGRHTKRCGRRDLPMSAFFIFPTALPKTGWRRVIRHSGWRGHSGGPDATTDVAPPSRRPGNSAQCRQDAGATGNHRLLTQ